MCTPPPSPFAQALPCPSMGARLTVVFPAFSDHGFCGQKCNVTRFPAIAEEKAPHGSCLWYFLLLIPTFCLQPQPRAVCFGVIFSHG